MKRFITDEKLAAKIARHRVISMKTLFRSQQAILLLCIEFLGQVAHGLELDVRLDESSRLTMSILVQSEDTLLAAPEQSSTLDGTLRLGLFDSVATERITLRDFQFSAVQPLNYSLEPLKISLASSNVSIFQTSRPDNSLPTWQSTQPKEFRQVHFGLGGDVYFDAQADECDLLKLLRMECTGIFDLKQRPVPALDAMPFSTTMDGTTLRFTGSMTFANIPLLTQIPSLAILHGKVLVNGEAQIPPFLLIELSEFTDHLRVARLTAFETWKIQTTDDLTHPTWQTFTESESRDDRWIWSDVPIQSSRFFRLIP